MGECRLCELPTPEPPVTVDDVEGHYCCRGCAEVATVMTAEEMDLAQNTIDERSSTSQVPDGAAETYLSISGMHCSTCEAYFDLRAEQLEGVYTIDANYAIETARVVYDPTVVDSDALPELLSGGGYEARYRDESFDASRRQRETMQRLLVGGFFTALTMPWYLFALYPSYVGLETGLLQVDTTTSAGFYVPLVTIGIFTTIILLYTGFPILRGAWVSIRTGHPNMDLLVAVAALAAYAYSTVAIAVGSTTIYYDVTVAVVMVVTLGRLYEGRIRSRATDRLAAITEARVQEATIVTNEGRTTVPIEDLSPGDHVIVSPGEYVPVDGTVLEGRAAVDESLLTGESLPVRKVPGESVAGGTTVTDSPLVVEVGPDATSTADRIATALWEIQSATPGLQRLVDRLATIFVPLVLALGVTITVWQLLAGVSLAGAVLLGLTVLIVSCPCAMGLASPLAIAAGLRDGLASGIVVSNESVFEVTPTAETVVFDKTGTLTAGEMAVRTVTGDDATLELAAAVERYGSHPVAEAILDAVLEQPDTSTVNPITNGGTTNTSASGDYYVTGKAHSRIATGDAESISLPRARDVTRHPGAGISGTVEGRRIVVGTKSLVENQEQYLPTELQEASESIVSTGDMPVFVGWDGAVRGVIGVGDTERDGWETALATVSDCEVVVLTGDDGPGADRFRDHDAVDTVIAGVPPDGKVAAVRQLSATEPTVMVGDGTNDAPALATADLGIAMGDGTARAVDAADVVITDNDLTALEDVFALARGTRRRIHENIGWAFLYNGIAIPLAALGAINPLFAAIAMATSSIVVVSNSRRPVF